MTSTTRTIVRRNPEVLAPHPELLTLFGEPSEEDINRLVRPLLRGRAITVFVEIVPEGEVLYGYTAVLAARRAGLQELEVILREDLSGRSETIVTLAVLDAAIARGGLSPLELTRCVLRGQELGPQTLRDEWREYQLMFPESYLVRRLGLSVRNVQRYLRLASAPSEIQSAYTAGLLSLALADRAAGLPHVDQDAIIAAIQAGEAPPEAVVSLLRRPPNRHKRPQSAWRALLKSLQRGLSDLEDRLDQIRCLSPEDAEVVDRTIAALQQVRSTAPIENAATQATNRAALHAFRGGAEPLACPDTSDGPRSIPADLA